MTAEYIAQMLLWQLGHQTGTELTLEGIKLPEAEK